MDVWRWPLQPTKAIPGRADGRTDGRTERSVLRVALSQLKVNYFTVDNIIKGPLIFLSTVFDISDNGVEPLLNLTTLILWMRLGSQWTWYGHPSVPSCHGSASNSPFSVIQNAPGQNVTIVDICVSSLYFASTPNGTEIVKTFFQL